MSDTIAIGGKPVARTVAGALGRLELETCENDTWHDVGFLRRHINRIDGERDELVAALELALKGMDAASKLESDSFIGFVMTADTIRAVLAKVTP
jgi:hypothetical protein